MGVLGDEEAGDESIHHRSRRNGDLREKRHGKGVVDGPIQPIFLGFWHEQRKESVQGFEESSGAAVGSHL